MWATDALADVFRRHFEVGLTRARNENVFVELPQHVGRLPVPGQMRGVVGCRRSQRHSFTRERHRPNDAFGFASNRFKRDIILLKRGSPRHAA